VNGLELFLLARKLMKIGEGAIPPSGFHQLPTSVRSILIDVFEHPNSSVSEITARTGFPQSHVSASVARLKEGGAVETATDSGDRRRTLVRPSAQAMSLAAEQVSAPIDDALAVALRTTDHEQVAAVVASLENLARRLAPDELAGPPRAEDFDAMYATPPPWDTGRPQPALAELAQAGAFAGRVLDVGCGTGEHALLAAALGLAATGIDISPAAIVIAQGKARDRDLAARFLVWNALDLGGLGEQFDTILDSGLFHVFDDGDRARYVDSLRAATAAGGRLFVLCFSDRQPGRRGPRRLRAEEIRASFADGWRVDAITSAVYEITIDPNGAHAWLATLTRI
jgi:SAM-dependent methyltransferase